LFLLVSAGGAVTHILNDVLSLQKIEDGALTLEFTTFDLERMLRTTLYSFKAPCTERSLRLKAQLADVQEVVWTALRQRVPAIDHCMLTRFCNKQLPRFGLVGDMHRLRQVRGCSSAATRGRPGGGRRGVSDRRG
jgi:signal transduction histidine kinase